MSAGPRYEYHWADGQSIKKPIKCSAPKYIDYLMTWVQEQIDDEVLFPSKIGNFTPIDIYIYIILSLYIRDLSAFDLDYNYSKNHLYFLNNSSTTTTTIIITINRESLVLHNHRITGVPFPRNFMTVAKTILKRLFRVYAHVYYMHFEQVCSSCVVVAAAATTSNYCQYITTSVVMQR